MAGNTIPIHGKVARTEKNGVVMEWTDGWAITITLDAAETSRQGQHWKEYIAGQAGWTGTISGSYVPGNTEQKAFMDNIIAAIPGAILTDVDFNLEDTGDYLAGNLLITNFVIDGRIGDKILFTLSILGTGALALNLAA